MITVETMVSGLEAGDSRRQAATRAFKTTAFPMLTGAQQGDEHHGKQGKAIFTGAGRSKSHGNKPGNHHNR
jgi:hypothetical protein